MALGEHKNLSASLVTNADADAEVDSDAAAYDRGGAAGDDNYSACLTRRTILLAGAGTVVGACIIAVVAAASSSSSVASSSSNARGTLPVPTWHTGATFNYTVVTARSETFIGTQKPVK